MNGQEPHLTNMKLLLPATINPPRLRKDGSASISFDTRELSAEEIFSIMGLRHAEGWLTFSPNENDVEIPEENAGVETKTSAQRLRSVLYVLYQQDMKSNKFVGLFETFYKERMEKLITLLKDKIE